MGKSRENRIIHKELTIGKRNRWVHPTTKILFLLHISCGVAGNTQKVLGFFPILLKIASDVEVWFDPIMDPPSWFHHPFLAAWVPLYLFRLVSPCIPSGHLQGPDTWEEPSFLENPAFSHLPVLATSPLLVWLVILQGPAQNFDHSVQNSAPHSKTGESRPVGWEQGRRTGSNEEGFFCLLDFFFYFWPWCVACGILVGIEPGPPCSGRVES